MTMIFFFHIQSSSFQGFADQPLVQRQNFFFLKPLLTSLLQFCVSLQMLYLYFFFPVSACVLTQSCILPVTHAAKHTTTHPSILSHMRHAQPDSWPRPPGGEDGALIGGRLVGGDEPGSSALSPDIHTQWVHSHTCLIAWPIGGGAHWGWRPLESEDRRIVMVRGSSQFIIKVIFISAFCCIVIFQDLLISYFCGCPWFSPGRHPSFFCCRLK